MGSGVVVIGGTAAVVSGASGATVSVIDSPVVISDVVTGPGTVGSWAALVPLVTTADTPMARRAPAPRVAEPILTCFEFTFDLSIFGLW
jgi:hypothetical protein